MESSQIVIIVLGVLFTFASAAFWYIIKDMQKHIDRIESKVLCSEEEHKEIKENYLTRFESVKTLINDNHLKMMEAIHRIELAIKKEDG